MQPRMPLRNYHRTTSSASRRFRRDRALALTPSGPLMRATMRALTFWVQQLKRPVSRPAWFDGFFAPQGGETPVGRSSTGIESCDYAMSTRARDDKLS